MSKDKEKQYRQNAVGTAVAGGTLLGIGANANYRADRMLRRSGEPGLWDATKTRKLTRTHGKLVGAKLGARSLQVTGLPLAAIGVTQIVRPEKNRKLDVKGDVVKPVIRNATFEDAAKKGREQLSKATEQEKIISSKQRARKLSEVAGAMGLTALGLRSPEIAASVARKVPKTRKSLQKIIAKEPAYTKASNTLGIGAIGTGSIGSFNFAHLQGLEAKRESRVAKRDDKFLREYKDRISPKAEASYNRMKATRKKQATLAGAEGALGGGLLAYGAKDLARGNKGSAALSVLGGALALNNASDRLSTTKGYSRAIGGIKDKAKERAALNQYGTGRVSKQQVDLAKAFMTVRAPQWGKALPKGILRKPRIRSAYIRRSTSGKQTAVRGSLGQE